MSDVVKTQHYTTKSFDICGNLIKYIPQEAILVDPFCGAGDLCKLLPEHTWLLYDVSPTTEAITQDTLLNPPDYTNKWVITNPPYLAKNKAQDKIIFQKYDVDDLYKAAILSILDCEGGILIVPVNFLADEGSKRIRCEFFKHFDILEMNVFTRPVFTTTTYSVCAFAFKKNDNVQDQSFIVNIKPGNQVISLTLTASSGYRIAGDWFEELANEPVQFGRLVANSKDYTTHIKLFALDTRDTRIRLEWCEEPYVGKPTDRMFATITSKEKLTQEEEKYLIAEFNKQLENFRKIYADLPLTNYRDYNRKRVGFTFVYQLLSKIQREKGE